MDDSRCCVSGLADIGNREEAIYMMQRVCVG